MRKPILPGAVIAERFEIETIAEIGGMGTVFRARDRKSGEPAALKFMRSTGATAQEKDRFAREAQVLSDLKHPGIVSYISQGHTPDGQPFFAMEWLDGVDLAQRLDQGGLTAAESLNIARRVAEALAVAHRRGIVHRDLKPSNLFLREGSVEHVTVLDFGVARVNLLSIPLTRTDVVVGTPGYMAPEQARAARDIGPSADIFSLGCVLFECLTGRPPFVGEHIAALLTKILFEEAPPLRSLNPSLPEALEALIARMLSKDPASRPKDAAALIDELDALELDLDSEAPTLPGREFTGALPIMDAVEQQIVAVVLASPHDLLLTDLSTLDGFAVEQAKAVHKSVRAALMPLGCHVEGLADGSVVATLVQSSIEAATDLAVRAARSALRLKEVWPEARVALATGRGVLRKELPIGEAVDVAGRLLRGSASAHFRSETLNPVRLDDVTASLVDGSFEVGALGEGCFTLQGERANADSTRPLLGKPTACVGREQELAMLEVALADCIERGAARAILITAPAGVGKSRLRHEFMRRLGPRENLEVLLGRGDPMNAGCSYGLVGQALRRLAGVVDGTDPALQQARLFDRVARAAPPEDARRIAAFLGELCGIPFPDEDVALLAARGDPIVMSDEIRRAFIDFLRAECAERTVIIVLEDLHWGDALTVRLIDAALAELGDQPLFVLALSRPEGRELFPRLWEDRGLQPIELRGLGKRACERLVTHVLGPRISPQDMHRIVAQADGNALYLEELIRAAAEGKRDGPPGALLAMLQARLMRLPPGERHVLLAASVFGETFWRGGVIALLGSGPGAGAGAIDSRLRAVTEKELIQASRESRLAGEVEHRFRHALMRDAAYGLLTDDDRALAHRAAGAFLERAGERDDMVLAEHYERGKESGRAGACYLRAARQAHFAGDSDAALLRAERGLRCDVPVDVRLALLALIAELYGWRGDFRSGGRYAEEVLRLAAPGSTAFWSAAATSQAAAALYGEPEEHAAVLKRMLETHPLPEAIVTAAFALTAGVSMLHMAGGLARMDELLAKLCDVAGPVAAVDPLARGWMSYACAYENDGEKSPATALDLARRAERSFEEAHHRRGALLARIQAGINLWRLGKHAEAEQDLRSTLVAGAEFGPHSAERTACLIGVLVDRGALDEARHEADIFAQSMGGQQAPYEEGLARWALADVLLRSGNAEGAAREAGLACERLAGTPLYSFPALVTRSAAELAEGRPAEALATVEEALKRPQASRAFGFRGAMARLVHAEALRALGRSGEAAEVITAAYNHLMDQSARIPDAEMRRSFLEGVPENARTLELARALGLPAPALAPAPRQEAGLNH